MNNEKQRIAIAEACGWIDIKPCDVRRADGTVSHIGYWGTPPSPTSSQPWLLDYLNDLNAMHEAEKALSYEQAEEFVEQLYLADQKNNLAENPPPWRFNVASATAAQRAEAFLRTIGKWEDEA